jgi:hypothetical protein
VTVRPEWCLRRPAKSGALVENWSRNVPSSSTTRYRVNSKGVGRTRSGTAGVVLSALRKAP